MTELLMDKHPCIGCEDWCEGTNRCKNYSLWIHECLNKLEKYEAAEKEGRLIIFPEKNNILLTSGMTVWYVDKNTGEIEKGEIVSVYYENGKLSSFSVDFKESQDFDEFSGSAWGRSFFSTYEQAKDIGKAYKLNLKGFNE